MDTKDCSRSLNLPPFRGRVAASAATPAFLAAVSDCRKLLAGPDAEILLDGRNKVGAVTIRLDGERTSAVVIKEYYSHGIDKLKSLFLPSKAAKAWRGAAALIKGGLETPLPLAWLEERNHGFVRRSFFLAERIFGGREIRHLLRELPQAELRALLAALAGTLRLCHEQGILHRDLSDGNILVRREEGAAGRFHFYFLDTNRIRPGRTIGLPSCAKNLIRLGIPAADRRFFLEQYARAGGKAPSRFFIFWYGLNKKIYTGYIGLKKKLKLKKLARTVRLQR